MTPVSVIVHSQGASLHDHICLCSPSISLFISLIFLKTLVSSLYYRDPKLCCRRNRNKLYVKFALEGSEVISLAITPAFLTNSWRPREAWPSWVLLQQRAVIHCQWAQCWKAGQLPSWGKGKAQSWKACQCECQRSWTWRKDDSVVLSEEKIIKSTYKGSTWASSPHFRRNTDMRSEMRSLQHFVL